MVAFLLALRSPLLVVPEKMAIEKQRAGLKRNLKHWRSYYQLVENTGGEIFGINGEMPFAINPKPSLLDDRWMEKP